MTDTAAPTPGRQFAIYDSTTSTWGMWPATGLWGSIAFSETWPRTGYMSDGKAYELPTSAPASAYSSSRHFPTPKAHDGIMGRPRTTGRPIEKAGHLGTIVTLLPTPTASDATGGGQHPSRRVGHTSQLIDTVLGLDGAPAPPLFDAGSD